jgi:hypothetical protein
MPIRFDTQHHKLIRDTQHREHSEIMTLSIKNTQHKQHLA